MGVFKTQIHKLDHARTFFLLNKACIPSPIGASFCISPWPQFQKRYSKVRVGYVPDNAKAVAGRTIMSIYSVKATVTVKLNSTGGFLSSSVGVSRVLHEISDFVGKSLLLELVSAELDPKTGLQKKPISLYARRTGQIDGEVIYESEFVVPGDFGEIGAVLVQNELQNEMYLKHIVLDGLPNGPIEFSCGSWIQPKINEADKRVFFTNKSYLPSQTPTGLERLRENDLLSLRGGGKGEYKSSDRIYDYDVYNDLGDPSNSDLVRPVLGGKKWYPYPRRCRTGRPRSKIDPRLETRSGTFYVPRDEEFSEEKEKYLVTKAVGAVLQALLPSLEASLIDPDLEFPVFNETGQPYNQGIPIPKFRNLRFFRSSVVRLVKAFSDATHSVLKFKTTPGLMFQKGMFSWFRDEEFARQTLAGVNPFTIKLVTEWPIKSALDPIIYGPIESAITTEVVERDIKDVMTVEEALEQKKLFIIDFHDMLLPYVRKVRQLEGTTLYGSRALFFLAPDGTLKPVAIELTRPPMDGKPQWKQVFTPSLDATGLWLWRFAKAHFLAHDSGHHELVSHWLRGHCATEPYIIATRRQLSVMHPIYRLLHPHCRYTLKVNAIARQGLINANGIIETSFAPGKYSMELSSVAYREWRFDQEALPADLINRGIAIEDPSAPHGLKLLIEDYPFANDGLMLWDALKQWVADYVNYYYKDDSMVESDPELQAWWTEIRTKGHEDKKDEPWWPVLRTPDDLIGIITTIVWVASAHHSAVNFGQYAFAVCFPIRPTIARTNMPCEDPTSQGWKGFLDDPNAELLACFPSHIQTTKVMAILDVLSNHSPDEEYLGEHMEPAWGEEPHIKRAFERFSERLKELQQVIDARNAENSLKNRGGAGVVPYELLKPFAEQGMVPRGVPCSISV